MQCIILACAVYFALRGPLTAMPTYVLSLLVAIARAGMLEALPAGMRLGHLAVLGALADRDSSSQRELGALLALHPTDLVAIIDDLVDRSLAEREVDPLTDADAWCGSPDRPRAGCRMHDKKC